MAITIHLLIFVCQLGCLGIAGWSVLSFLRSLSANLAAGESLLAAGLTSSNAGDAQNVRDKLERLGPGQIRGLFLAAFFGSLLFLAQLILAAMVLSSGQPKLPAFPAAAMLISVQGFTLVTALTTMLLPRQVKGEQVMGAAAAFRMSNLLRRELEAKGLR